MGEAAAVPGKDVTVSGIVPAALAGATVRLTLERPAGSKPTGLEPAAGDKEKVRAVMLANHGPVVAGKDVEAACNAIEELEATARLAMLTCGCRLRQLRAEEIRDVVTTFNVEWEA